MRFFITGTAGFIGFHLAHKLLEDGHEVFGFDGLTPYYDPYLKKVRRNLLLAKDRYSDRIGMLEDASALGAAFESARADIVVHLAAQAGVRYGLENPGSYITSNLVGTQNLLELCRHQPPRHLLIASTSSVYGGNEEMPFIESARTDFPISLYAATKKGCESLSHSYSHLFAIPTTMFRFFTVYGPWGRPDMALFKFVSAMEKGLPIDVYGDGTSQRDYTYVQDLVEAIVNLTNCIPQENSSIETSGATDSLSPVAPWRAVNIGGGTPVTLNDFIATLESVVGRSARRNILPLQPGDVTATFSDTNLLEALTGAFPQTKLEDGLRAFVDWFRADYAQLGGGRR